jgi:hypothetical protein
MSHLRNIVALLDVVITVSVAIHATVSVINATLETMVRLLNRTMVFANRSAVVAIRHAATAVLSLATATKSALPASSHVKCVAAIQSATRRAASPVRLALRVHVIRAVLTQVAPCRVLRHATGFHVPSGARNY